MSDSRWFKRKPIALHGYENALRGIIELTARLAVLRRIFLLRFLARAESQTVTWPFARDPRVAFRPDRTTSLDPTPRALNWTRKSFHRQPLSGLTQQNSFISSRERLICFPIARAQLRKTSMRGIGELDDDDGVNGAHKNSILPLLWVH